VAGSGRVDVLTRASARTIGILTIFRRDRMTSQGSSHTCRAAPIEASHFLQELGFDTLRVSNSNIIDLVAWKDGRVVFLAVKRSRSDGIAKYSAQVFQMVEAVREKFYPGELHFWLCRSRIWHRYQILEGGAAPVEWSA